MTGACCLQCMMSRFHQGMRKLSTSSVPQVLLRVGRGEDGGTRQVPC